MNTTTVNEQQPNFSGNAAAWHRLNPDQALQQLNSNLASGLGGAAAQQRLQEFGSNELVELDRRSGLKILFVQLQSSLVVLLLAAMVISALLGEFTDAIAVFAIIVLNTLLGFWQDYQAEKSLAALKKLAVPEVLVRRDGVAKNIAATQLVPGDIVILQAGYFVPADCRVLESTDLSIDESALTGESLPVAKTIEALDVIDAPIGDQTNRAFMGTMVVRGHGIAVVTTTGMRTQLGQIASSLQSVEPEPTPLQIRLGRLSRTLALAAVVVVGMVFVAGLAVGQPSKLMLMTAISLAVAIVPEGLPAVATVALAISARRMFKRNTLIRQLPAVETLGSVSVICSDKTGTLTQNKMTATILDVAGCRLHLGREDSTIEQAAAEHTVAINLLLLAGCLCNDAQLQHVDEGDVDPQDHESKSSSATVVGEPTEAALVEVAWQLGLAQPELHRVFPRIGEIAFDSERKRMATRHAVSQSENLESVPKLVLGFEQVVFVKGAVEAILEESKLVWVRDQTQTLDKKWLAQIEKSRNEMASQGTRVLAFGFRRVAPGELDAELETEIVFVGMIGLTDPPRPEAKLAVDRCRAAGIRPVMITGDHPLTALSIARQLGISDDSSVVSGQELAQMPADELRRRVGNVGVYARVAPSDKLHIVEALQHNREVVAMTGDGVNDAPALKQANVGVAMGQNGTDVSIQAADVVLLDDNFSTIVAAVEQGRIVYDNVRKFVKYTMSSNVGEVLVMTVGILMGMPLPLLPLQVLWVNLVTDGLPGLALAIEPAEKNTMSRAPFSPAEPVFNRRMTIDVMWIGLLIAILSLVAGNVLANSEEDVIRWRTIIFTVLTFAQMGNALACRSDQPLLFNNQDTNLSLWGAIAITGLLQLAVVYLPFLQDVFGTKALSVGDLALAIVSGVLVFGAVEIQKRLFFR